jgi:hypothetical protein
VGAVVFDSRRQQSFMRRAVAEIVVETLARLPLAYPRPSDADRAAMEKIRHEREQE